MKPRSPKTILGPLEASIKLNRFSSYQNQKKLTTLYIRIYYNPKCKSIQLLSMNVMNKIENKGQNNL